MKQNKLFAMCALFGALIMSVPSFAIALATDRATPQRDGQYVGLTQGSNVIYAGSIVAVNASGVAVAASDATGLKVVGKAEAFSDNTGAAYDSAKTIKVRRGVFRWENGGSLTITSIGNLAYVADDQTVTTAASAAYDIVAGIIVDVDSAGIWVDTYAVGGQGAASVTTLAASGNASIGGTLAVTGASALTGNTIVTGTVSASGYKIGGVSMYSGTITNLCPAGTNITTYVGGCISNNVVTP